MFYGIELSVATDVKVNPVGMYISEVTRVVTPVVYSTSEQRIILIGDALPIQYRGYPGLHNFFQTINVLL